MTTQADQPIGSSLKTISLMETMSVSEICAAFIHFNARRESAFKAQGRVIYALKQKLKEGETIYGTLKGMVSNGTISNAIYASKVFEQVVNGVMSDDDYERMTFEQIFRAGRSPTLTQRPTREIARTPVIQSSAGEGILDDTQPVDRRLASALDNAKIALISARELIGAERLPRQWDAILTGAITATTRVAFLAKEEFHERASR